jgi:hypothetical protein
MSANTPVPDELAAVRDEIKRLQDRESHLRQLLIANPDLREGAGWLAEIKDVTRRQLDTKELRADHPAICEEYTHPVTVTHVALSAITEDGEIVSKRRWNKEQGK